MVRKGKKAEGDGRRVYAPILLTGDSVNDLDVLTAWVTARVAHANRSDVMRTALKMAADQVRKKPKKSS